MTDQDKTKIDRIHELLTGGDDPRKGVVYRLESIEEAIVAERRQREEALQAERERSEKLAMRLTQVEHNESLVVKQLTELGTRIQAVETNMNWIKWIGIALLSLTAGGTGIKVAEMPAFSSVHHASVQSQSADQSQSAE